MTTPPRDGGQPRRSSAVPWWLLLALYSGLIFFQSSRPVPESLSIDVPGIDKVVHFGLYGIWASVCFIALRRRVRAGSVDKSAVIAAIAASLYGLSDELHQRFVPGRSADAMDLAADVAGAVAAALAWRWLARRQRAREPAAPPG